MRSFLALLVFSSLPGFAANECVVDAGPHDVVKKTGDVIIEAGQIVEDAIALDGMVIVKNGAKVKNAISFHGSVLIDIGGEVTQTALAIGGKVKVIKGGSAKSVVEISEKGLRVRGDDGDDLDLNIVIGGKSLGQRIADEALAKMKNCQIVATK